MNYRKCLSPIVATALLLVVVVVAVAGFQTWYQIFESSTFSDVEQESQTSSQIYIETLVGTTLYVKGNTSIEKIIIDGVECDFTGNISGIENIDVSDCLVGIKTLTPEIVIQTKNEILSKKVYLKSNTINIYPDCKLNGNIIENGTSITAYKYFMPYNNINGCSNISQTRICTNGVLSGFDEYSYISCNDSLAPSTTNGEWILEFGNSNLETSDFYVMKYEAKNDGSGNVISQASGDPWVSINQTDARIECSNLGNGYSLITDPQWVTLGRDIESQNINWNTGEAENGYLARGWAANIYWGDAWTNTAVAPSTGNSCLYNTGVNTCGSSGEHLYKRILELSNGEVLWDLSGNVWEWTDKIFEINSENPLNINSSTWYEWTNISNEYNYLTSAISTYNSSNAIGQVYINSNDSEGIEYGFLRGGNWYNGNGAGIFSLNWDNSPSNIYAYIGFRCSYQS